MHLPAIVAASVCLAGIGAVAPGARAQSALCAKVRLEIPQRLTLERDAFAAKLVITNNLGDVPLEDIAVTLEVETAAGDDASTLVFIGVPVLTAVTSIDGLGRIAPGVSAEVEWLFVPTAGAGGADPAGLGYRARATLHYRAGTAEADLVSTWADFTVMPQPLLDLIYALPRWVDSDDPFTLPVEPPVPFDLAVRVDNVGHGEARGVRIASAQPRIVDNQAGLLIDFEIVGAEVDGIPGPGSLMLAFGNIAAGACDTGAWVMKTTLKGAFTSLDVAFSHDASLGGADTSLIGQATTRWLLHRVHSETRGVLSEVDQQDDFLVEPVNAPPLGPGLAVPDHYDVLQSSCAIDAVARVEGALTGTLAAESPVLTADVAAPSGLFVAAFPDPTVAGARLVRVTRVSDGEVLHPRNAWIGVERDGVRRLFIYDLALGAGAESYQVEFMWDAFDVAPPVSELVVASGPARRDGNAVLAAPWTIFSATAVDDVSGVAAIEMSLDGGAFAPLTPFHFEAGVHEVRLRATDLRGNAETARAFQILVDDAPPSVVVGAPESGRTYASIAVDYDVIDDGVADVTAEVRPVAGGAGLAVTDGAVVTAPAIAYGKHELVVTATDWLARTTQVVVGPFTLGPPAPTIRFASPEADSYADGPVLVEVETSGAGLGAVALTIDDVAVVAGEPYGVEGAHMARARVTDAIGVSVEASVAFVIDRTTPAVSFTNVADSTAYAPGLVPEVAIVDASPVVVEATLDGAVYALGTPIAAEGTHVVEVSATDRAGHIGRARVSFAIVIPDAELDLTVTLGGSPVADARVLLVGTEVVGRTDASGRVRLVAPSAGEYEARVDLPRERRFGGPWMLAPGVRSETLALPTTPSWARTIDVKVGDDVAMAIAGAGRGTRVRLAAGEHVLAATLVVPDGIVIEGGFDAATFAFDREGPATRLVGPAGAPALDVTGAVHAVLGELEVVGEPAVMGTDAGPLLHDMVLVGAAGDAVMMTIASPTDVLNVLAEGAVGVGGRGELVLESVTVDGGDGGIEVSGEVVASARHAVVRVSEGVAVAARGDATLAVQATLVDTGGPGGPGGVASDGAVTFAGGAPLAGDPRFVAGPRHGYYLAQGGTEVSPAVDAGLVDAAVHPVVHRTTAGDGREDGDRVDLGYHAWPVRVEPGPEAEGAEAEGTEGAEAEGVESAEEAEVAEAVEVDGADADDAADSGPDSDTFESDTFESDTFESDTFESDTFDTTVSDTTVSDTTIANTTVADTTVPDTTVADTRVTEVGADAAPEASVRVEGGGCGCGAASSAGDSLWLALVGLGLLGRTRRRAAVFVALGTVCALTGGGDAHAAPSDGPQPMTYYGRSWQAGDVLKIMGFADNTEVVVTRSSDSVVLYSGTLSRWGRADVTVNNTHIRVESGAPIFAFLGHLNGDYGGTFYYPSTSLGFRTGTEFVFFVPTQGGATHLNVLAYEAADVTLYNEAGTQVFAQSMGANSQWLPAVVSNGKYRLVSTGRVAVVSNTRNGFDVVPESSGKDVGRDFLFVTSNWASGCMNVFAYENAHITAKNLAGTTTLLDQDMAAGGSRFLGGFSGASDGAWHLTATGNVGVWAGDCEGGSSVSYMGDDLAFNEGIDGRELLLHTQLYGATLFASRNGTSFTWRALPSGVDNQVTLNRNEFLNLAAGQLVEVLSNQPLIEESFGGTSLNDYGAVLRPVPAGNLASFRITPSVASVVAGTPFDVDVTALDDLGGVRPGYLGTLALSASGHDGTLPAPYTFTAADLGSHHFSGVVITEAGSFDLVATDTQSALATAKAFTVLPGPIDGAHSTLAIAPQAVVGDGTGPVTVTLDVADAYDNPVDDLAVDFAVDLGVLAPDATSTLPGRWVATWIPPASDGLATITATIDGTPFRTLVVDVQADVVAPPAVHVNVSHIGGTALDIGWTAGTPAATDVARHEVRFAADGAAEASTRTVAMPAMVATLDGLAACTPFTIQVRAVDRAGNVGALSAPVHATTVLAGAPSAPTNPHGTAGDGWNTLTWDANSGCDVRSWRVVRRALPDGVAARVAEALVLPSYTDRQATNDTAWGYTVTAVDAEGLESAPSAELVLTPHAAPPAPPVANLALTAGSARRMVLAWDPAAGADHYTVYRAAEFLDIGAPLPEPIATAYTSAYTDAPPTDGAWAYSVVAWDTFDKPSLPAPAVAGVADGTVPTAAVALDPTPPFGLRSQVDVTLTASEPLAEPPTLAAVPPIGVPVAVALVADPAGQTLRWTGVLAFPASPPEGAWRLSWTGKDLVGQRGAGAPIPGVSGFDVDFSPPRVAIDAPAVMRPGATALVFATLSEPLAATPGLTLALPDGRRVPVALDGAEGTVDGTIAIPADALSGTATFEVDGEDPAGNRALVGDGGTLVIDADAPSAPPSILVGARTKGTLRVQWQSPPEALREPLTYTLWRRSEGGAEALVASGIHLTLRDDLPPADGVWSYAVAASDVAGNVGPRSTWASGTSDQTAPGAPTNLDAGIVNGQVHLTWEPPADAVPVDIVRYAVRRDGALVGTTLGALETNDVPPGDGTYTWTVTAFDAVQNESAPSAGAALLFDEAPPVVTITGVIDGDIASAAVTIAFSTTDASAVTLAATLDAAAFASGGVVSAEGAHTLVVTAQDDDQRTTTRTVHFTIDTAAPVVTIEGIADGAVLTAATQLRWSVTDQTAVSVTARLDGASVQAGATVQSEGPHTLVVTAQDAAQHVTTKSVSFTLDVAPPAPTLAVEVALDDRVVRATVLAPPSDVVTARCFREGVLVAEGPVATPLRCGAPPAIGAIRGRLEVELVDATAHVGARRAVDLYGIGLTLGDYGHANGDGRALARWMLDLVPVRVQSGDLQVLGASALHVALADNEAGTTWFERTAPGARDVPAEGALTWDAVVHSHRELTDRARAAIAVDIAAPGAPAVRYTERFDIDVGWPAGETANMVATNLWRGADGLASLAVTNHGSAPLALKTRTAAGAPSGELELQMASLDGAEIWARANVEDTGLPTVRTNAGVFVVVPPGETLTFPPIALAVPPDAGDHVRLAAHLARFHGEVTSTAPIDVVGRDGETFVAVDPPPYDVTLAADATDRLAGEPTVLHGEARDANHQLVPRAPIHVRIRRGSFEELRNVTTDASGAFTLSWTPLASFAGRFRIAADHPAVTAFSPDVEVAYWALVAKAATYELTLARGSTDTIDVVFGNLGDVELSGLAVVLSPPAAGNSEGLDVTLPAALPVTLAGLATLRVPVTVTADEEAAAEATRTITVTTAQGATATTTLKLHTRGADAVPRLDPAVLRIGLRAGDAPIVKRVLVQNVGFAPWRNVRVTPPAGSLVRVSSATALGDLMPSESRLVDITVSAPAGTATGTDYGGYVAFDGDAGVHTALPVGVAVTTDLVGSALVQLHDLTEQLTTPDAPVAGVGVTLTSLGSGLVQRHLTTDAAGIAAFDALPAGTYRYRLDAPGYALAPVADVPESVEIVAGQTTPLELGLIRSPVSIDFTVTPVTVTDTYDITITTNYQSSIPAPALAVIPAQQRFILSGGETTTGQLTLFNAGLASAWHVRLAPRDSTYVKLAYAVDEIPEIPAKGQVTVPFTVHLKSHGSPPPPTCGPQCTEVVIGYEWYCNTAGMWVPQAVTQQVCVDVPPCQIRTNQPQVTRVNWIGCDLKSGSDEPLCITNASGGEMKLCNCGIIMAQGIGLSSLSDLIKGMAFKVAGKIRAIGSWLAAGPHVGLEDLEEEAESVANLLDAADQILEDTSQMVDEANASQCDEEGMADQIENRLIDAAEIITEETVRSVLEAVTGGALTFQATALTFDKDCLAQGEETCADTGDPDYILGMGGMNFCVSCGSCDNPSERGPDCPMTVQFADITAYCGPGLGLVIQNIRGNPRYDIPWLPQWTGSGVDISTGHICEPGTIVPF